jgi:hypothetical protein
MQWSYLDLWRVTQHERFPTKFTYLKGSSMELLTLEPTSKIDFGLQHNTLWKTATEEISRLWAQMEFTPNSCSSKCPRAPIYRLGVRMGVRQKYAWEPSGRWTMAVRTDNCATGFSENFTEKSFLYKNIVRTGWLDRPDGRTSAVSNFHNRLPASGPWGRNVRTDKLQHAISIYDARESRPWGGDVWTVEVESAVTIYDALASGPQLSDVRTVHFELRILPYRVTRPDGIPHRPDGWLIFLFLNLERISEPFANW